LRDRSGDEFRETGARERPETRAGYHARGYRRSVRGGLLVSAVLHALVAIFLSGQFYIGSRTFRPVQLPPRPAVGLQVVDIRDVETEAETEDVIEMLPEERDDIQRPEPPTPGGGDRAQRPGSDDGFGLTNAERLQPREGDPRLWQDFGDRPMPEYLEDRFAQAEGVIRARLGAMLDSLALTEEQRRRAVEWLFGEGDQQWGVTPDGIVLGGMVIPMNVGALFEAEGPLGRELRQEARDLADIQRQDFRTDVERSQRERLEEMRRLSEEEAERRRQDSIAAEADTTGSGRSNPRD
jgi:hypothetical protein